MNSNIINALSYLEDEVDNDHAKDVITCAIVNLHNALGELSQEDTEEMGMPDIGKVWEALDYWVIADCNG